MSSITLAELGFGAAARRSSRLRQAIRTFAREVAVFPFDEAAAEQFAAVAAVLARRGEPIGTLDTLVAAHALSLGVAVVTSNTRHFGRVHGLVVENWV